MPVAMIFNLASNADRKCVLSKEQRTRRQKRNTISRSLQQITGTLMYCTPGIDCCHLLTSILSDNLLQYVNCRIALHLR